MKFRLRKGKGSVSGFTDSAGVTHLPGDAVELPASYKGEAWLECLEAEKKVKAAPSKIEVPVEAAAGPAVEVPLEAQPETESKPKPKKSVKKAE